MQGEMMFVCEEDGFMVRDREEQKIMDAVKKHAREEHGMDISDEEIRLRIETV